MTVTLDVTPVPKPRMVQSDRWRKRPAVERYWRFKNELKAAATEKNLLLTGEVSALFLVPMPASWSKAKRARMNGQPHQQRPDADNFIKALLDCLLEDDSGVWKLTVEKRWSDEGRIVVRAQ